MPMEWTGEAFLASVEAAAEVAVGEAVQKAAAYAATNHAWQSRTGEAEADIFADPPSNEAGKVVGEFGDASDHAIFLEFGTINMQPRPFLRPALDAVMPDIPKAIGGKIA